MQFNDFIYFFIYISVHFVFTENMKNELKKPEVRDRIGYLSSAEFGIVEQKGGKGKPDNEPQASFRKLNIDWRKIESSRNYKSAMKHMHYSYNLHGTLHRILHFVYIRIIFHRIIYRMNFTFM